MLYVGQAVKGGQVEHLNTVFNMTAPTAMTKANCFQNSLTAQPT